MQRLQEELKCSRQSEAAAAEQARSFSSALEHQKAAFEVRRGRGREGKFWRDIKEHSL